ncbi:hypothetical protein DBV39_00605 [Orrella marina]|uniref:Uncharacterized protein n=1 Tax=Orrella marina TaxID=2163011 RepID=A0A2R4XF71_9BURK|nr:hypothetical protein DBV39_00605 [Orrella marina]
MLYDVLNIHRWVGVALARLWVEKNAVTALTKAARLVVETGEAVLDSGEMDSARSSPLFACPARPFPHGPLSA